MSIYLVALVEPNEEAWASLKEKWAKRHFILTDRLALVATESDVLTEDVCEAVGMNEDVDATGFVAEIDYGTINGWTRKAFWEWLRKNR